MLQVLDTHGSSTFFLATLLIATRSPLKMPIVVKTCVGGKLPQLAIEARPELTPNCVNEKFLLKEKRKKFLIFW